ncbi:hypothetical protein BKA64DRAFT_218554 [Cadophora sp. MPI-SDFR-AT-0126]|nr:hypothetical protein BKA64DRAFT_218554 [Leotiomycetes sp. MPI-SDFR-AT-0126]
MSKDLSTSASSLNSMAKSEEPSLNLVDPQPIVTIHVIGGDYEKQSFKVHKNYICHYSPFFEAALNGPFIEGQTQEVDLTDTPPFIFGTFVNWLYTQKIINRSGKLPSCISLSALWILADKLLVPSLQNQALSALNARRVLDGTRLDSSMFNHVYENTASDSPLRRYIVDSCSKGSRGPIMTLENYPPRLLVDIINEMRAVSVEPYWEPSQEEVATYFVPEEMKREETG